MILNVGQIDRVLRLALGALLILAPFALAPEMFVDPALKYGALVVGGVLAATALVRFCPIYRLLGVCTTPRG